MKKLFFITMSLAATASLTSCDSAEENRAEDRADRKDGIVLETAENDRARTDYKADYDSFKNASEARIDENERKIDELDAKMDKEKKEVKEEYKQKIQALKERNKELRRKMRDYKNDDNDNEKWESFKREFNHDADEVGNTVNDLERDNVK